MRTVELEGSPEPIRAGTIICIGRNYAEHAKEMKSDVPTSPIFFLKPASALIHDGEAIVLPSVSKDVHHEVEMTVLIGKGGKNISRDAALDHVAGYGIGLDMTLRDIQAEAKKKGLPWALAKGFDTSAPISRFVSASKVPNPQAMTVELSVNGTARQKETTAQLIFPVQHLIAYLSQFITLERGDIIYTGTPEGVAQVHPGDTLSAFLKNGSGKTLTSLTVRVQ
ncbi:MAG: fumarylacetoacetate hydrolase family protein [Ignavibacteriae bacterium]|nr:fumarylacetoacetate hydrolase family protein [Ignavibacteriota bacterium]